MYDPKNLAAECHHLPHLPQTRVQGKQLLDDTDSRVSTDSDLDLETELGDDEDEYKSTFSALLTRRLRLLEKEQALQEEELAAANVRPPLLTAADDSFSAKMFRVFKWTRTVSAEPSECPSETSSESNSPPPNNFRKRRLSDASFHGDSKRPRIATVYSAAPGSPFFPTTARMYQPEIKIPPFGACRDPCILHARMALRAYPSFHELHVCTACDTSFASPQRLHRHGHGALTPDACKAAVTYRLE
ncbi:hypothetical protein BU17DRAFT_91314 [Hysterangium stoloniferum]|nr:hypothetical protein BU17DRAFT_91314 [Hysterangium stoloniferum]